MVKMKPSEVKSDTFTEYIPETETAGLNSKSVAVSKYRNLNIITFLEKTIILNNICKEIRNQGLRVHNLSVFCKAFDLIA